eukprot:TRINITY_DN2674_c0_g1_i1.p1 TRINITY_DN2674_c0_g1~~TRINITY_DN2674_c0_g1_i1.p1  ORF type:complete len:336 (+),score=66.36 TRINITY_DN2674_c0_g1_i1:131-1138(+)
MDSCDSHLASRFITADGFKMDYLVLQDTESDAKIVLVQDTAGNTQTFATVPGQSIAIDHAVQAWSAGILQRYAEEQYMYNLMLHQRRHAPEQSPVHPAILAGQPAAPSRSAPSQTQAHGDSESRGSQGKWNGTCAGQQPKADAAAAHKSKRLGRAFEKQMLEPGLVQPHTPAQPVQLAQPSPMPEEMSAEAAAESFVGGMSTAMVRNIPLRYITEEILAEFIGEGFGNAFDFFYLPIDFKSKRNRGYCFVNFVDEGSLRRFALAFHGKNLAKYQTKKILTVQPAAIQGLEANTKKYMHMRVANPWFRPMFFDKEHTELPFESTATFLRSSPDADS